MFSHSAEFREATVMQCISDRVCMHVCIYVCVVLRNTIISYCGEQDKLKERLEVEDGEEVISWEEDTLPFTHLITITGVDISFHKAHPDHACAMLTVLKFPQLKVYRSMYMYRASTRATSYLHSLLVCVDVWMCVCVCVSRWFMRVWQWWR